MKIKKFLIVLSILSVAFAPLTVLFQATVNSDALAYDTVSQSVVFVHEYTPVQVLEVKPNPYTGKNVCLCEWWFSDGGPFLHRVAWMPCYRLMPCPYPCNEGN